MVRARSRRGFVPEIPLENGGTVVRARCRQFDSRDSPGGTGVQWLERDLVAGSFPRFPWGTGVLWLERDIVGSIPEIPRGTGAQWLERDVVSSIPEIPLGERGYHG